MSLRTLIRSRYSVQGKSLFFFFFDSFEGFTTSEEAAHAIDAGRMCNSNSNKVDIRSLPNRSTPLQIQYKEVLLNFLGQTGNALSGCDEFNASFLHPTSHSLAIGMRELLPITTASNISIRFRWALDISPSSCRISLMARDATRKIARRYFAIIRSSRRFATYTSLHSRTLAMAISKAMRDATSFAILSWQL
jgi:hypothetical protein